MPRSVLVPGASEEEGEQIALFTWIRLQQRMWPELALVHHIPNGGHRTKKTAGRMKALGAKAGVADIFLPVSRHGYHGLYIEMKSREGRLTPQQQEFLQGVANQGYAVFLCRSFTEAKNCLTHYLFGPDMPDSGTWVQ
jgi:hypothetical protein